MFVADHRDAFGGPRITAELRAAGRQANRERAARVMRGAQPCLHAQVGAPGTLPVVVEPAGVHASAAPAIHDTSSSLRNE
ncbi:hypothetical protein [Planomonospora alba]|uniref:hypothetical protein n=1 Tax=Planomonospora alba TaxID=161354 RepID=UPI0031E8D7CD